jgi:hypothetical protein
VASAILLFGVVALIAINIELLTFADALTNTILLLVAPARFPGRPADCPQPAYHPPRRLRPDWKLRNP